MIRRPGTKQVLVPLQPGQGGFGSQPRVGTLGALTTLEVDVAIPFGPLGLFLWGALDGRTYVHDIRCLNWIEGLASKGRIPGKYFSTGKSFAELEALAKAGELFDAVQPEQLLEMHEVGANGRIGIAIEGPFTDACFWGLTYSGQGPRLSASLTSHSPNGEQSGPTSPARGVWQGRLVEHRLLADELCAEVQAESEESAIRLLEIVAKPWRGR